MTTAASSFDRDADVSPEGLTADQPKDVGPNFIASSDESRTKPGGKLIVLIVGMADKYQPLRGCDLCASAE